MCNSEIFLKIASSVFKPVGMEHWAFNVTARLDFHGADRDDIVRRMRCAWAWTRYHHPLIAVQLMEELDAFEYKVITRISQLNSWMDRSFETHWIQTAAFFLTQAPDIEYSSFHFFAGSSEILIRIHRCCIDSVGAMSLLDRFLVYLTADENKGEPDNFPVFGDEYLNLSLGHTEVAGLPFPNTIDRELKGEYSFLGFVATLLSCVGNPSNKPVDLGGTKVVRLSYPARTLADLNGAVQARGIGLRAAVQTAVILATRARTPLELGD